MTKNAKILVVDDDSRLRELLTKYLYENHYKVEDACDAEHAAKMLANSNYDLIILDVMMPGKTGFEFAHEINSRGNNKVPILYLSAMGDPDDRIKGLELGAEDYLTKPFEPKELLLRCNNILKRNKSNGKAVKLGDYILKVDRGQLSKDGIEVPLTSMEVALLKAMGGKPGEPISRDELAELSGVSLSPRTVDVQITRLRKKIEPDSKHPIYIKTVRHKGYALWPDQ